jgi:hypothetical protein
MNEVEARFIDSDPEVHIRNRRTGLRDLDRRSFAMPFMPAKYEAANGREEVQHAIGEGICIGLHASFPKTYIAQISGSSAQ